ncbi:OLC1v1011618C1 [Oldenlandia corymbosa var. corymbosa]|uniref:Adenylyltransferase and sulfurtransferase MOCS3 n=1 Tax=Oldenlandia corymbosa var. corymbosa TaxID=529605 RepID=A0AAV1DTZ8_OLDCO|nr:OLC1v1011618C1 [Oldenlandia corymbosa var. corymbosa]
MESNSVSPAEIIRKIESLKSSKNDIERQISALEAQLEKLNCNDYGRITQSSNGEITSNGSTCPLVSSLGPATGHGLAPDMIYRYSRQLLLPSFGVQGQANLLKSSVLVIGAGGLGSPALLYLAACGVGRIGIVDHDVVELNNLHRQIIHTEAYIGKSKVESAAAACRAINSNVEIVEHREAFRTTNALDIVRKYPSFHAYKLPLVSGAALGLEGQLTVYNYNGGPCYRCLFPTPPPTTACQRCSDSGVLGVVPGVIGCLQALEAVKIASAVGDPLSGRMLLFDALSARMRIVKIRGKSAQCEACGDKAALNERQFQEIEYEIFTQTPFSTAPLKLNLLPLEARITSKEYYQRVVGGEPHVLVDVRPAHHYKIVSLPNSINIPLSSLEGRLPEISDALGNKEVETKEVTADSGRALYVVCRRGNDSQRAVQYLNKMGFNSAKDIIGGLQSWADDVDPKFPMY